MCSLDCLYSDKPELEAIQNPYEAMKEHNVEKEMTASLQLPHNGSPNKHLGEPESECGSQASNNEDADEEPVLYENVAPVTSKQIPVSNIGTYIQRNKKEDGFKSEYEVFNF